MLPKAPALFTLPSEDWLLADCDLLVCKDFIIEKTLLIPYLESLYIDALFQIMSKDIEISIVIVLKMYLLSRDPLVLWLT